MDPRTHVGAIEAAGPPTYLHPDQSRDHNIAIEMQGITKVYGDLPAVRDLSLAIFEREFFSLLGPSGCGKTTTLNLIGGFLEPDAGQIRIQGRSVAGIPPYRRPVNTVFQNLALFPHMSVYGNIAFGLRMKRVHESEIAQQVKEMLDLLSLTGLENRRPSQLSGGQQQRVALARALVNRPAVLLLDEPLGSLDQKLRKQMQLELTLIQREVGITFVYVTHDQEEAMTMSDRIAVMNQGTVIQVGTPREVYEKPATWFVADFMGTSNTLLGHVEGVQAETLLVRLSGGDLVKSPATFAAPIGMTVSIVVRPEYMKVSQTPLAGDENSLRGKVTRISYLGTHVSLVVSMAGGFEVVVHEHRANGGGGEPFLETGKEVYVSWPPSCSMCFARQ